MLAFMAKPSMSDDVHAVTATIGQDRLHLNLRMSSGDYNSPNQIFSIDLIELATLNPSIYGI